MNRDELNYLLEQIEGFNAYKAEKEDINWLATKCIKILNIIIEK